MVSYDTWYGIWFVIWHDVWNPMVWSMIYSMVFGPPLQVIADVISISDHITLNTNTPTRVPNTTLQQSYSPDITTVSNTLYNRTSWTTQHAISSDHLPIITTIKIRHDYRLQQKPTDIHQLHES